MIIDRVVSFVGVLDQNSYVISIGLQFYYTCFDPMQEGEMAGQHWQMGW